MVDRRQGSRLGDVLIRCSHLNAALAGDSAARGMVERLRIAYGRMARSLDRYVGGRSCRPATCRRQRWAPAAAGGRGPPAGAADRHGDRTGSAAAAVDVTLRDECNVIVGLPPGSRLTGAATSAGDSACWRLARVSVLPGTAAARAAATSSPRPHGRSRDAPAALRRKMPLERRDSRWRMIYPQRCSGCGARPLRTLMQRIEHPRASIRAARAPA